METLDKLHDRIESFLRDVHMDEMLRISASDTRFLLIDFSELDKYDFELADYLVKNAEETIKAFDEVLDGFGIFGEKVRARFTNLPASYMFAIRDLRSTQLGNMIVLEGIIRQASEVRPEVMKTVWECPVCGNEMTQFQTGFTLEKPKECVCGNRKGFILRTQDFSDVQKINIEENPERLQGSEQPARLNIILRHDLVDPSFQKRVSPGNIVRAVGMLKETPIKGKESKTYDIYLEANYIEPLMQDFEEIQISMEDEKKIKDIASGDPWKSIVVSIAPSIYGYDKIKEAIALQLFGGIKKRRPDGVKTRGDMHVLLVGDPGAGKSQLLKYVSDLAPKSRYVSGKGASAVGLTASVVKDEFLKGWTLEAGALVLANGGIVCIDEMDKISRDDVFALHEAMEQQSITIAKANIFATLKSETSILSAANPKYGRFDLNAPIAEQIAMPETILSRFDLIFPVKDIPTPEKDEKMAEHILRLHKSPEEAKPLIERQFMKKYVAYAKKNVKPKISDEALDAIKDFFVSLRSKYAGEASVPISPRQLEALVRMTEASARLRLSPLATKDDAEKAIDLLRYTLFQLAYDAETGKLDIDRIEGGTPASKRSKIRVIIDIIQELEKSEGKQVPRARIMDLAMEREMSIDDAEEILDSLRMKGHIIEPKQGYVERVD